MLAAPLSLPSGEQGLVQTTMRAIAPPSVFGDASEKPPSVASNVPEARSRGDSGDSGDRVRPAGAQSAERALDILEAIAEHPMSLADLAAHVGLSSTTCYRLTSALVARRLVANAGRRGYSLGERVSELALAAAEQRAMRGRH
ncbi:helix-turn-helix domain-containing protein [Sphingomonas aliaeris]|uniref:Helix-turn-helix domain-containing protein n=1 Tax=Sphingomonas aliaeris TaxID=2759526 RepID=A0A974NVX0_9SPHN|nr:helix-turn-helix domain-containing protein [Sphingomonas aliaeris]QQV77916.1 helix-turn-helix domain-containing protein [Sphingomonas aliaeris]